MVHASCWSSALQARPNRITDMFAKAAPAQAAPPQQRDAALETGLAAAAAAEPALRTPHLSGRFGAMGMTSPAAAVASAAATGQPAHTHSRARKQLFAAEPAAISTGAAGAEGSSGAMDEARGAAAAGCVASSSQGGDAGFRQIIDAAPAAAAAAAQASSEEASWPETGTGISSRRSGRGAAAGGGAVRQLAAQHRKPNRKAPRTRLAHEADEVAGASGAADSGRTVPIALPPAALQQPQVLGAAAAAGAAVAQAVSGDGGGTPINLITPERLPDTVIDLTASDS